MVGSAAPDGWFAFFEVSCCLGEDRCDECCAEGVCDDGEPGGVSCFEGEAERGGVRGEGVDSCECGYGGDGFACGYPCGCAE